MELLGEAEALAKPKAIYKEAYIDSRSDDTVTIDGKVFTSRILRANTDSTHRLFPYVSTCGSELDNWSNMITDRFKRYIADTIKQIALNVSVKVLLSH